MKLDHKAKKVFEAVNDVMGGYSHNTYLVDYQVGSRFIHLDIKNASMENLFTLSVCNNGQIMGVSGIIYPWLLKNIQLAIYKQFNAS